MLTSSSARRQYWPAGRHASTEPRRGSPRSHPPPQGPWCGAQDPLDTQRQRVHHTRCGDLGGGRHAQGRGGGGERWGGGGQPRPPPPPRRPKHSHTTKTGTSSGLRFPLSTHAYTSLFQPRGGMKPSRPNVDLDFTVGAQGGGGAPARAAVTEHSAVAAVKPHGKGIKQMTSSAARPSHPLPFPFPPFFPVRARPRRHHHRHHAAPAPPIPPLFFRSSRASGL